MHCPAKSRTHVSLDCCYGKQPWASAGDIQLDDIAQVKHAICQPIDVLVQMCLHLLSYSSSLNSSHCSIQFCQVCFCEPVNPIFPACPVSCSPRCWITDQRQGLDAALRTGGSTNQKAKSAIARAVVELASAICAAACSSSINDQ